ncbi:MAG: hypothetical protein EBU82_02910 [Flavobacteriia bacterium]|jgi:hypothetical protein|nr:hypothetical protein [Flavobacteriia bacterium]
MKKGILMLLVAVLAVASSCSKDAKINRRLDGEWKVVTIAGVAPAVDESYTLLFNKIDKLTGSGILTYDYVVLGQPFSTVDVFSYSVVDQKMTLIVDGTAEIWSVTKYEKDRMEMVDSDGDVWVLDPK